MTNGNFSTTITKNPEECKSALVPHPVLDPQIVFPYIQLRDGRKEYEFRVYYMFIFSNDTSTISFQTLLIIVKRLKVLLPYKRKKFMCFS